MAPQMKKIKTYGPSNTSLVNNSVDAFNVLFSNHKRKTIIKKKRKKMEHLTKELLTRPKFTSGLTNDSFQISMNDTFDKVKQSVNKSKSLNKSEVGRFISEDITIHSPILLRRRKNFLDSSNSLQISEISDSYEKTHLKILKGPSEDKIDGSLEIEVLENKQYLSSLSYINVEKTENSLKISNSLNCSKLGASIDTFSKHLAHCSTPVSQFKHPNLINQTVSPAKINSLVHEESSMFHTQSKNLNKTENRSMDRNKYVESESSDNNTPQKRKSFITLRKRKILKTNVQDVKNKSLRKYLTSTLPSSSYFEKNLESFNDSEKQGFALTTSLDSFAKFENKIAYISKKLDSKDNFVTKRRAISKEIFESNDLSFGLENGKYLETNKKIEKEIENKKKMFIELQRLPLISTNSSTKLESDFEKFYSHNISSELADTKLENKTDNSLEKFEQFYTSNYICSQNSDQCAEISFLTSKKTSAQCDSLEANRDEFEKFYVSHYSCKEDTIQKNIIIKDLRVNIIKESLRAQKNKNILGVSNDLNTDNIEKEIINETDNIENTNGVPRSNDEIIDLTDSTVENIEPQGNLTNGSGHNNRILRIELTRNNFSDLMTAPTNDSDSTVKCIMSNNTSTNYEDHYDICNFPLPTVEDIGADQEKFFNLVDEESLDVIESSYIESQLLDKSKKKTTKNSLRSKTSAGGTKCEKLQTSSEITPNKSTKSGTIQNLHHSSITTTSLCQKIVNNSCGIIDRSRVSRNTVFDKGSFKMPKSPPIHLKGGKSWKRSMSIYRNSIGGFSKEDGRNSYLAKTCPKGKLTRLSNQRSRRLSICLVPMLIIDLEKTIQNPLVEYALSNSYVPDQIIEGSLEDSFRCLSLNHVNTLNKKSQLDQVPISAKDIVLRKCGQTEPLEFSKCFPDSILSNCQKIGEGVFGEVFLFRNPKGGTSVIKIVPVEGDLIVNGERQKKFEEVLSEIIITMELSNLRNNKRNGIPAFTEVQKIQCVQGKYPEKLVFLWDEFDETRHSENDCPDMFRNDQLYIVFQMAYGGKDLESFEFNNAMQAYSMFQQVAIGLAVAEEELHFEHRDLHWGNVLVSAVETNKIASFNLNNRNYELPTQGVEVAIIDFTLSRIEHNGVVIFNDLSMDPDLFVAEGDYQFDIYRLMQDKNRNNWKDFEPFTNLLWLHYILDKAIRALRYKNIKSKKHRDYIGKLKMLKENVLCYHNVKEFVFAKLLEIM
ncbi:unnamed protein product [Psylliodes chrysocephalus]|uniref:non-specific serine/threonine protein kinase n=1 Tax=Psylliodes chrysocephalus TaxID=3402493 RepID=A0A9P0GDW3_9CUCU|nr:unnamed protein product [Psylliodes chrysocephala]